MISKKQLFTAITILLLISGCAKYKEGNLTGEVYDAQAVYSLHHKEYKGGLSAALLPDSFSLKKFCPPPFNQTTGTCFAIASAYSARTTLYNVTVGDSVSPVDNAFSNGFLVALMQPKIFIFNQKCSKGNNTSAACKKMEILGVPFKKALPGECLPASSLSPEIMQEALEHRIISLTVFYGSDAAQYKINAAKQSLAEQKPLAISWKVAPSFNNVTGDTWTPSGAERQKFMGDTSAGGHAICVIGYNNNKNGGSFEIMNSWAADWANHDFCWITYADFAEFSGYGVELSNVEKQ